MVQQGQILELTRRGLDGEQLWAYRYRTGGRDSRRVQRGGFACELDARDALERELERLQRERRISRRLTLAELVEAYLAQPKHGFRNPRHLRPRSPRTPHRRVDDRERVRVAVRVNADHVVQLVCKHPH